MNKKLLTEADIREYNDLDFDRNLVLKKRTGLVAAKVTEFLKATDRFAKTIVFCENIDHAERMRQAGAEDGVVPPDDATTTGLVREDSPSYDEHANTLAAGDPATGKPTKYYVDDVEVTVATERVHYLDADGRLIAESLKDYTRKAISKTYTSLDTFLSAWSDAERKLAIIEELAGQGVFLDELAEQVGRDYDAFDLVCHVAFDQPPLTRRERADNVRKRHVFVKYGNKARAVLDALLEKYADVGIRSLESLEILKVDPLTALGTPVEIVNLFGGKQNYLAAIRELEIQLYQKVA